jgi:putative ABC transport system permease protein
MNLFQLSTKEWQRRPIRTLAAVVAVGLAVAVLFSLIAFQRGYQNGIRLELDRLGAHILVVPKGCPYDAASIALHGARWPCYLKERYLDEVRFTRGVAVAAPVFMTALDDANGQQIIYEGVDTNITVLKPGWRIRGNFPSENEILIGSELARSRGWSAGATVNLPGLPAIHCKIAGILEPTQGSDDEFIYLPLKSAQKIFAHPAELTHILVRLQDPEQMESVAGLLRGCDAGLGMNIVPLAHLFHTIRALMNSTRLLFGCIVFVAVFGAGAGVANALLISVAERTREIGIMRAVGASKNSILVLFLLESAQICFAGASLGVVTAFLISRILDTWLRAQLPFSPRELMIHWEWSLAVFCYGAALLLGILAGVFPAWKASRLAPLEAFRFQARGL